MKNIHCRAEFCGRLFAFCVEPSQNAPNFVSNGYDLRVAFEYFSAGEVALGVIRKVKRVRAFVGKFEIRLEASELD